MNGEHQRGDDLKVALDIGSGKMLIAGLWFEKVWMFEEFVKFVGGRVESTEGSWAASVNAAFIVCAFSQATNHLWTLASWTPIILMEIGGTGKVLLFRHHHVCLVPTDARFYRDTFSF